MLHDPVDSERRRVRHHMGMHVVLAAGDIENRDDCERLVRAFYGRTLGDPVIGWIFVNVAQLRVSRCAGVRELAVLIRRVCLADAAPRWRRPTTTLSFECRTPALR
jgi:hypothetical protein